MRTNFHFKTVYNRGVKHAACGLDAAHTGHAHPGSARAKTIPIRHDMARDVIRFDTPGL